MTMRTLSDSTLQKISECLTIALNKALMIRDDEHNRLMTQSRADVAANEIMRAKALLPAPVTTEAAHEG